MSTKPPRRQVLFPEPGAEATTSPGSACALFSGWLQASKAGDFATAARLRLDLLRRHGVSVNRRTGRSTLGEIGGRE
jgi:hypothetical protein